MTELNRQDRLILHVHPVHPKFINEIQNQWEPRDKSYCTLNILKQNQYIVDATKKFLDQFVLT